MAPVQMIAERGAIWDAVYAYNSKHGTGDDYRQAAKASDRGGATGVELEDIRGVGAA